MAVREPCGLSLFPAEADYQSVNCVSERVKRKEISSLTPGTDSEQCSVYVLTGESVMFRSAIEEVSALMSLGLFVSMIAIWAQVIALL
jgi:hypothetical protein